MQSKNRSTKNQQQRGGQTLIGLLVVVAIIMTVAGIYLSAKGKNPDGSTSTHTVLRRDIDLAQETVLVSNLNQIQLFMVSYKSDNNGQPPATFDELKKQMRAPAEFWINPVDKKPLGYNPQTGLMIVTPYEGESAQVLKMTQSAANVGSPQAGSTPAAPSAPGMPNIPTIPDSGTAPPMDDSQ
jgi:type II secretory pathway pseudopilin PulG